MTAARTTAGLATAALMITLGACGSDAPDDGETTGTAPTTATAGPSATATDGGGATEAPSATQAPTTPGTPTQTPTEGDTGTDEEIPTNALDYADALVVAWGVGDTERMAQLAAPEVVEVLGDAGGPNWARVGADSGAGSTFVTYEESETGETLELRVQIETAGIGQEHAVVEAKRSG